MADSLSWHLVILTDLLCVVLSVTHQKSYVSNQHTLGAITTAILVAVCRVSVEPHSSSVDLASTHTHVSLPLDTGAPEKIKLGRVRRPSEREVRIASPTRDRKNSTSLDIASLSCD